MPNLPSKEPDNQILKKFYNRLLPLYPPQAEKFLDTAQPGAFAEVAFRYTFSVEAMTKVSHIIEDAAMINPGVPDFHVSFQQISRVVPQRDRYEKLSERVKGLWIYGESDVSPGQLDFLSRPTLVDTSGSLLTSYWFVVAYGPGLGMTLLAEEVSALSGSDRYYEGFYTFEPDIAYQIVAILHKIYPNQVLKPISPELITE